MLRKLTFIVFAAALAPAAFGDQFIVGGKTTAYKGPFSSC